MHIWSRFNSFASTIIVAVSLAACAQYQHQPEHTAPPEIDGMAAEPGSLDNAFTRIGLRVPGFAGLYVDPKQALHVRLVGDASRTMERSEIVAAIETAGLLAPGQAAKTRVVLEKSNTPYTWSDLAAFKAGMRDVLALPDVSFLDADEVEGVVIVGIAKPEARTKVQEFAAAVGLSLDAWRTVLSPYRDRYQDLTDQLRPMVGGIQIKNDAGPFSFLGFSGMCTLTVVADRFGVTGFITNSHCTRVQGGTEGTKFHQNGRTPFSLDYVAHESEDPPWTASLSGCPAGFLCRRSDSAFAVIDIGNQFGAMGLVARPSAFCLGSSSCSTAMGSTTAFITLTGISNPPLVGSGIMSKVGRTSGWTGGVVSRTCIDTPQLGTTFMVLCQSEFTNGSSRGDSGSPMVVVPAGTSSGTSPVSGTLAGVLWGGVGLTSTFSPIGAVIGELAPIRLFPPVSSTTPSSPPSACVVNCRAGRDACMRSVSAPDGPRPQDCVSEFRGCLAECP